MDPFCPRHGRASRPIEIPGLRCDCWTQTPAKEIACEVFGGQVTLPLEILERLGMKAIDTVFLVPADGLGENVYLLVNAQGFADILRSSE